MSTAVRALPGRSSWSEGLAFVSQMLIAISFEVADDIGRGFFSQHGTVQGVQNAHRVVAFEAAHGFWVEPAWQMFFQQSHRILLWSVGWAEWVRVMNGIYILGHICVTVGVALWVYIYRRKYFALLRNILIVSNAIALGVYENFPVAPPRMTPNLMFDHRAFHFQDTINGVIAAGRTVVGTQASGYNEFSAMPSVHMIWAILAGASLVILARPILVRVFGAIYPVFMLVAVVVTANHYLMDVVGALIVLGFATAIVLTWEYWWSRLRARNVSIPRSIGEL